MILALVLACRPGGGDSGAPADGLALTVEATDMATVLWARWSEATAPVAALEVEVAGEVVATAAVEVPAAAGEALLRGLPSGEDAVVTALDAAGEPLGSAALTIGQLPASLPELSGEGDPSAVGGFVLTSLLTAQGATPVVLDGRGRYVWALPLAKEQGLVSRVLRDPDGQGLVFAQFVADLDGAATVRWVDWEGHTRAEVQVPAGHTDLVALPDGRVAVLTRSVHTAADGTLYLGDELTLVEPGGAQTLLWEAVDAFTLDPADLGATLPGTDPPVRDWSHVNSVDYDEASGLLLLTAAFDHRAFAVELATGQTAWSLTNDGVDPGWTAPREGELLLPHSARAVDGGVLVFNRAVPGEEQSCARVLGYALPAGAAEAVLEWSWRPEECMEVVFLGSAEPLPGGGALVSCSSLGRLDEVDAAGATVRSLGLGLGAAFGFADHAPAL